MERGIPVEGFAVPRRDVGLSPPACSSYSCQHMCAGLAAALREIETATGFAVPGRDVAASACDAGSDPCARWLCCVAASVRGMEQAG